MGSCWRGVSGEPRHHRSIACRGEQNKNSSLENEQDDERKQCRPLASAYKSDYENNARRSERDRGTTPISAKSSADIATKRPFIDVLAADTRGYTRNDHSGNESDDHEEGDRPHRHRLAAVGVLCVRLAWH